jgi:hypothetical protein
MRIITSIYNLQKHKPKPKQKELSGGALLLKHFQEPIYERTSGLRHYTDNFKSSISGGTINKFHSMSVAPSKDQRIKFIV